MAEALGFSVFRSGWTGQATFVFSGGSVVVSPDPHTSTLSFAEKVLLAVGDSGHGASFSYAVNSSGRLVYSNGSGFTIATTADIHTRTGFNDTSYSSSTTHAAERTPPGSFYPYSTEGMRYTLDVPTPRLSGLTYTDRALLVRTPGTDWKSPGFSFECLRPGLLEALDSLSMIDTPGKISLYIGSASVDHHMGRSRVSVRDGPSGWSRVDLEVIL